MAPKKKSHVGSRRGLTKVEQEKIANQIIEGYRAADGCPPLSTHWGGHDLRTTDWLKRFAAKIADDQTKVFKAWNTIKEKCDTSSIIELLYLCTIRSKVYVDESQDQYHALIAEVERMIPKYDKLLDEIIEMTNNPDFSITMPYVSRHIAETLQKLRESKQSLEEVRSANLQHGSYKRNARDWYLFLMATELINSLGRPHVEELATLLEAAQFAHNEIGHSEGVAKLTKRIQRWKKYFNAEVIDGRMMFRMGGGNTNSRSATDDDPIPF